MGNAMYRKSGYQQWEGAPESGYQEWSVYPNSPVLTSTYPYQLLGVRDGIVKLIVADDMWWGDSADGGTYFYDHETVPNSTGFNTKRYDLDPAGSAWTLTFSGSNNYLLTTLSQCNYDVYTDNTLSVVRKSKTTTEQVYLSYPVSPVLTSDYPYQILGMRDGATRLFVADDKWWGLSADSGNYHYDHETTENMYAGVNTKRYDLSQGIWSLTFLGSNYYILSSLLQCNYNIYTDQTLTVVRKFQTTLSQTLHRIRNLHHKDGASVVRDKAAFWVEKSVNGGYQKWTGYPDSLDKTATYPYQTIIFISSIVQVIMSETPFYMTGPYFISNGGVFHGRYYNNQNPNDWDTTLTAFTGRGTGTLYESNCNVFADDTLTSIYFSKTTTPSQDVGVSETLHRINI